MNENSDHNSTFVSVVFYKLSFHIFIILHNTIISSSVNVQNTNADWGCKNIQWYVKYQIYQNYKQTKLGTKKKHKKSRAAFQYKDFPGVGISIIKIRRSCDHLILIMGIPMLVRWHLYIKILRFMCELWLSIMNHDDVIKWKHLLALYVEGFTGHHWITLTKASDTEVWCFLWFAPE